MIGFNLATQLGNISIASIELDPEKAEADIALYNKLLEYTILHAGSILSTSAVQHNLKDAENTISQQNSVTQEPVPQTIFEEQNTPIRAKNRANFRKFKLIFIELCEPKWGNPKTKGQYDGLFNIFERIFGDKEMDLYTEEQAIKFSTCLKTMPAGWLHCQDTKSLSLEDAIKLNKPKVTKDTADSHLMKIKHFFSKALKLKYVVDNIFEAIEIDKKEKAFREPFTAEELKILFEENNFISFQKTGYPSHYWVPLLAIFTGARKSEIFFLISDNVYEKDGIWTIDINNEPISNKPTSSKCSANLNSTEKKKSTKNCYSIRKVPIHQKLIDLGFLQFIEERKKDTTDRRVFKEYAITKTDAGTGFSNRLKRWIDKTRSKLESTHSSSLFPAFRGLHSFRHLFISETREQEMDEDAARKLTGHSVHAEKDTHSNYGGGPSRKLQTKRLLILDKELQSIDPSMLLPPIKTYSETMKLFMAYKEQEAILKKQKLAEQRKKLREQKKRKA